MTTTRIIGRGLGALSLGLGAAQLLAPRRVLRSTGFRADGGSPLLLRLIGLRELVAGTGLVAVRRPAPFAWMRVAGDAMDLTLMGAVARRRGLRRDRATAALGAVAAVTAADLAAGVVLARRGNDGSGEETHAATAARAGAAESDGAKPVRASTTIQRPRDELYAAWRDLAGLPRFMEHLESVTETGNGRSHWVAKAPAGTTAEWDAEITEERPGERLAWASVPGSGVANRGAVEFRDAPGDHGTEVMVELAYEPPAGALGVAVATILGREPGQEARDDLHRFKQLMETGEVPVSRPVTPGKES